VEIVNTAISAAVVAAVGLILGWLAKGRFDTVQKQIEALDARVDGLHVSLDAMRNQFQGSLDSMRSDLTQVALAVGARPRAENA